METAKLEKLLKHDSKVLRLSLGGFSHRYISRYIATGHIYTGYRLWVFTLVRYKLASVPFQYLLQ